MTHSTDQILKFLADCDGACLYWQMPDGAAQALAAGRIKQVGELLVHPEAIEVEAGVCYAMPAKPFGGES